MARRPRGQLRQDILTTVIELLIDTGDVDSVSIDAVVDRVGCTPPALYYYFPTKAELLRQACGAEFQKLAQHIESDVQPIESGSVAQLIRRGDALLHWAAQHPALYRILFMGSGRDGMTGSSLWTDPSLLATRANVEQAMARGLIRPRDPALLTLSLWGLVHGYAAIAVTFPGIPLVDLQAAQALALQAMAELILTEDGAAAAAGLRDETGETGTPSPA